MVWILLFVDEESEDKGERLLLSISVGGRSGRQWNGEEFLAIFLFQSRMKKLICDS